MRFTCDHETDTAMTMQVVFVDGNWWAITFYKDGIFIYDRETDTSKSVKLA